MHKKIIIAVAILFGGTVSVFAQSGVAVKQSGNITPNTIPWWITSGVIGGGVTAADSPISSFGATGPICSNSARQSTGGWQSICLQANQSAAATISLQNYGTASPQALQICVNGTCSSPNTAVPFVINPPAGTNTQGLVINQSTPATGSVAGPVWLNAITVIDQGETVTGTGIDAFGQINKQIDAFRLNHRINGGGGNHGGLSVATNIAGANDGAFAGALGTYQNVNAPSQFSWGLIGYAAIDAAGHAGTLIGISSEILVATGGSVVNRVGVDINSQGPVAGSGIDAAIVVDLLSNNAPWNGAPAPWFNFVYFSNNLYSANAQPISQSGNIFASDTMSINNFVDFSNVQVLGYIARFPSFVVPGNLNGFVLPAPSHVGAFQFGAQTTFGSTIENVAFTGSARFTGRRANTSSVAPSVVLSGEPIVALIGQGFDGTTYIEAGSMQFNAAQNFSSGNNGSYFSVFTVPLNSSTDGEVVRIQQGLKVGTPFNDPGAGIIDATNGYKSGGVAGVSCVVTTPAHITVVNGIVTLCN